MNTLHFMKPLNGFWLFLIIPLLLITGCKKELEFTPENSQINPRKVFDPDIFTKQREPSWENFFCSINNTNYASDFYNVSLFELKSSSLNGLNLLKNQDKINYYSFDSSLYEALAEYNILGQEAILTQISNIILNINIPFPITDSKPPLSETSSQDPYTYLKQLERVFLFLNTDLIPLIPFLEENFDNTPAFPAIICALINMGEAGLPSLLKTQSLDSELQRHLGLFGMACIAQDCHLRKSSFPSEYAEEVHTVFLRYLQTPSTNHFPMDSPCYNHFENYLNSIFCLALNGLTLTSSSLEQCLFILQREAAQHPDPTVRWFALTQLGFILNHFTLKNADPVFADPLLKIAQSTEEKLMIRTLAETLLCSFEETPDEDPEYYYPFGRLADCINMTRVQLPALPVIYDTVPYATVWNFTQENDFYPYPSRNTIHSEKTHISTSYIEWSSGIKSNMLHKIFKEN